MPLPGGLLGCTAVVQVAPAVCVEPPPGRRWPAGAVLSPWWCPRRRCRHRSGQPPAGLLVIAFPGGSGTASLLHQAHRLQGLSSLPIELIDLAIA